MNSKAKQPTDTGWPPIAPTPETNASRRPDALYVERSRSRYVLESTKPSGSCGVSSASSSWNEPASRRSSKRRRSGSASWLPHPGQTFQFASYSARATTFSHLSHLYQMPSPFAAGGGGADGVDSFVFIFFCFENQAMGFLLERELVPAPEDADVRQRERGELAPELRRVGGLEVIQQDRAAVAVELVELPGERARREVAGQVGEVLHAVREAELHEERVERPRGVDLLPEARGRARVARHRDRALPVGE